jgi:hypothetical protein
MSLPEQTRDLFRDSLLKRTERLLRLLNAGARTKEIGTEINLIFRAGMGYCGAEIADAFKEWMLKQMLKDFGCCPKCAKPLGSLFYREPICKACELQYAMEDVEHEDTMEADWGPNWQEHVDELLDEEPDDDDKAE